MRALLLFASLRIADGYADHYYAEHYDALAIMTQSRFLSCVAECVNVEFKLAAGYCASFNPSKLNLLRASA